MKMNISCFHFGVPHPDVQIAGDDEIICPSLVWDYNTSSRYTTISGSKITSTEEPSKPETACGMEGYGLVLTSRPLVIKRHQRVLFNVKARFSLKRVIPENTVIFEIAVTRSPIDCTYNQFIGLSVATVSCLDHGNQLCLRMSYNKKQPHDVPITKNKVGESYDLHLCFLLDGNTNKIHVIDASDMKFIKSFVDVEFYSPLWILMCIDDPINSDMTGELLSGRNIVVSENMNKLLSSCR